MSASVLVSSTERYFLLQVLSLERELSSLQNAVEREEGSGMEDEEEIEENLTRYNVLKYHYSNQTLFPTTTLCFSCFPFPHISAFSFVAIKTLNERNFLPFQGISRKFTRKCILKRPRRHRGFRGKVQRR